MTDDRKDTPPDTESSDTSTPPNTTDSANGTSGSANDTSPSESESTETASTNVSSGESSSGETNSGKPESPNTGSPTDSAKETASSPTANEDYYSKADLSTLPENADIPPPPPPKGPSVPPTDDAPEESPHDVAARVAAEHAEKEAKEGPITLLDHLGELRSRLVKSFIIITLAFFACYSFADVLFHYLALPLMQVMPQGAKLIFTGIPEGFFVYLKVAFVAAVFVASPYIFYQIWSFIAPGLYDEERSLIIPLALCSAFFFIAGASFCYFMVFPFAFTFFMSYSTDTIVAMPTLNEYLGFSLKMLIAFGLIFEMPLFAFFLARMGIITAEWLRKQRRYAALVIFVVAAILTPPDIFSQLLMAVPMLILYEISILVAATFQRKKKD